MKGKREHRVPLSVPAIAGIKAMAIEGREAHDFIFFSRDIHRPLSNMAMDAVLRRLKLDVTVHGFRSSFRDWFGEETSFPREIAEAALAHLVGDATERAYRRGDALAKRRELMDAWATFRMGTQPAAEPPYAYGRIKATQEEASESNSWGPKWTGGSGVLRRFLVKGAALSLCLAVAGCTTNAEIAA